MYFQKEFSMTVNGSRYNVWLEGHVVRDEHDRNKYYSKPDRFTVEDDEGNPVDETHQDWEDLEEEITNGDYEPDHWG